MAVNRISAGLFPAGITLGSGKIMLNVELHGEIRIKNIINLILDLSRRKKAVSGSHRLITKK
jgi:hypothetical protein